MSEATSPEANPLEHDGAYRYVAGVLRQDPDGKWVRVPIVDYAEKARLDAQDAYRKAQGENVNMNGLIWPIQRVERRRK